MYICSFLLFLSEASRAYASHSRQSIDMVLDFRLGDAPDRKTAGYTGEGEIAGSPWWMHKSEVNCVRESLNHDRAMKFARVAGLCVRITLRNGHSYGKTCDLAVAG